MTKEKSESPSSGADTIPNPLEKPEEFFKVKVEHGCMCLRNHFKIPAGSAGYVYKPMLARLYKPDADYGAVIFFWERHGYHEPARCTVPTVNVKADAKTEKEIVAWREANAKKEEKPAPAKEDKKAATPEPTKNDVIFMTKANFTKAKGKHIIAVVEERPHGRFEMGVLCVKEDGEPQEDSNTGTPMTFESEKEAQDKLDFWQLKGSDKSEVVVLKIGKVQ